MKERDVAYGKSSFSPKSLSFMRPLVDFKEFAADEEGMKDWNIDNSEDLSEEGNMFNSPDPLKLFIASGSTVKCSHEMI